MPFLYDKVKRYSLDESCGVRTMEEAKDGSFVLASDYDALLALYLKEPQTFPGRAIDASLSSDAGGDEVYWPLPSDSGVA